MQIYRKHEMFYVTETYIPPISYKSACLIFEDFLTLRLVLAQAKQYCFKIKWHNVPTVQIQKHSKVFFSVPVSYLYSDCIQIIYFCVCQLTSKYFYVNYIYLIYQYKTLSEIWLIIYLKNQTMLLQPREYLIFWPLLCLY